MGKGNRFANMNKVYVHTKTARKDQLVTRLWHMSGGPNNCRCQPRPRFMEAEGKFIAERWQYKEDQFRAKGDQF